ncbi:MAG TPA: HAMP domain-containing sensor histidine kinase [Gemmatimonadales bacterium]|nr:HAMP domain-containing sensor histidine kinase [Gemmatimonadales bacterium]
MALPFRQRIFVVLVALTAVPTTLAVVGWALSVRTIGPSAGARASLEQVATSARAMLQRVDTTRLAPGARAAVRRHLTQVANSVTLARQVDVYLRYYTAGIAIVILALGALVLFAAVRLAGHLSRQLSRPIDELVGWTRLIRQREPLPGGPPTRGAPEFESLRQSLRDLAQALDTARDRELEAERLRAFREVARRVAHEIKNPLTSMRIAVDQLERGTGAGSAADPTQARTAMAVEVLGAETDRLERLAREFADFGRLPEGPKSEVDLQELLTELGKTAVPEGVTVRVDAAARNGNRSTLLGHYEPLRRAFQNLLRNAAEAMGGRGAIDVRLAGDPGALSISIADHGPGIPADVRHRIFEPYFTTKSDGTGLGLALVRQALEAHGATIDVSETPGGGATFTIVFPA